MKAITNILTVYATEKGHIKDAVIQKDGKLKAHLIASPELTKSVVTNHPFNDKVNLEQFSKVCDDFIVKSSQKESILHKRKSK